MKPLFSAALALILLAAPAALARADSTNMKLLGSDGLEGRAASQVVVDQQNGHWIAYVGHYGGTQKNPKPTNPLTRRKEDNGTSILDVTDPRRPRYLHHLPGAPGLYEQGGAPALQVCNGKDLPKGDPKKVYLLRSLGNTADEIWEVSNPAKPELLAQIQGMEGTGPIWWECDSGVAYLVAGTPGWRAHRMAHLYDLANPEHPVFIRDFGLVGQQPGSSGAVPPDMSAPFSPGPHGSRVYFGYGASKNGVLEIVDREKLLKGPRDPTPANLLYPQVTRFALAASAGVRTVLPLSAMKIAEFKHDQLSTRDFVLVTGEAATNECQEPRQMAWLVDVTDETTPMVVSSYTPAEESGDFCTRGGRFGTHSSAQSLAPLYDGRLVFFAAFNAGVRAVDIRDPYHPIEVGHYVPAPTAASEPLCADVAGNKHCTKAAETNDVAIDGRGYLYIVDRAGGGMEIIELTGEAKRIAEFPR